MSASSAAADSLRAVSLDYVGAKEELEYIVHPEAALYSPGEEVSVMPSTAGGPAPTGGMTFYLDGKLAGYGNVGQGSDGTSFQYFQANPGTYTLTAHYNGDANYAPADLPATTITIARSFTSELAPRLTIAKVKTQAIVISGSAFQTSFSLGLSNATTKRAERESAGVDVYATATDAPSQSVFLGSLSGTVKAARNRTAQLPLKLALSQLALTAGEYQLSFHITANPDFANLLSSSTITVADPVVSFSSAVAKVTQLPHTLVSGAKVRSQVVVTVTITGNVAFDGALDLSAYLSPVAGQAGATVSSSPASRLIKLAPGKRTNIAITLTAIQLVDAASSDNLVVELAPSDGMGIAPSFATWKNPYDVVTTK